VFGFGGSWECECGARNSNHRDECWRCTGWFTFGGLLPGPLDDDDDDDDDE
jgi:hypothetical protein